VAEIFIQHVRHQAEHVRKIAGGDFIFEVAHHNGFKIVAHEIDCLAPIKRNRPECSFRSIMRPVKVTRMSSSSVCFGQFGSGNES
jgi:hypothetical protein